MSISKLLVAALAVSFVTVCAPAISFADDEANTSADQKEIGSDKKTGGPTQTDRDTVKNIQDKLKELKEKSQKPK